MIRFEPDPKLFEDVECALGKAVGTGTGEARAAIGAALTFAYVKLRDHAAGYQDTDLYQLHQRDRHNGDLGVRRAAFDRGYAAGLLAAAADVAKLLGVDEADLLERMLPPCQPIGCDNGIHLPGCAWVEVDADDQGGESRG